MDTSVDTTMDTSADTTRPVVVAIGTRGSASALEHAAGVAVRRHVPLHLVHAAGDDGHDGAAVISEALARGRTLVGGIVPVTAVLDPGPPVDAVAAAGRHAGLVVVGRCPESRRTHPYVRSVTGGVGARLSAPVVSVPDGWTVRRARPTVVVGIDEPGRSADVLRTALEAAHELDARLVVLTTWWRTPLAKVTDRGWPQQLEAAILGVLDRVGTGYEDVPVEVHVRNHRPGEALLVASLTADLLVLGRHASLVPSGSHLGPVARSVVREASCPVLLAVPRHHHGVVAAAG